MSRDGFATPVLHVNLYLLQRQKTAVHYRAKPNELDVRALRTIPDAPRTSSAAFPPSWDWNLLDSPTSASVPAPAGKLPTIDIRGVTINSSRFPCRRTEASEQGGRADGSR